MKVLLGHGAKVNVQEPVKGQSALMWAASEGNTAAAELLIEFGADIKAAIEGRIHSASFRGARRA